MKRDNSSRHGSQPACTAFYRLPHDSAIFALLSLEQPKKLSHYLRAASMHDCFVLHPFSPSADGLVIEGQTMNTILSDFGQHPKLQLCDEATVKQEYTKSFEAALQLLDKVTLPKLVLSRRQPVAFDKPLAPEPLMLRASEAYPDAFVAFIDPGARKNKWFFASPELLLAPLQHNDRLYQTMAMAGTMSEEEWKANNGRWDIKDIQEQHFVYQDITNVLAEDAARLQSEMFECHTGSVVHLAANIVFESIADVYDLLRLAGDLHPTPATAGFPVDQAIKVLRKIEPWHRNFYGGYYGVVDSKGHTMLHVGLRALEIAPDLRSGFLWTGGGILPQSTLDDEWQETNDKMKTILALFD